MFNRIRSLPICFESDDIMTSTAARAQRKTNQAAKADASSAGCCTPKPLDSNGGQVTDCQPHCECLCVSDEGIRMLAYLKWEAAGCPQGRGLTFWLEAEQELDAKRSAASSATG